MNHGKRNSLLICLFTVLLSVSVSSQEQVDWGASADLVSARRAESYIKTFNTGDTAAMAKFFAENIKAELLKERSVAQRVGVYKQMYQNFGKLTARKIIDARVSEIRLRIGLEKGGEADFIFEFEENQQDPKIISLSVRQNDGPDEESQHPAIASLPKSLTATEAKAVITRYVDSLAGADLFSGTVLALHRNKTLLEKAYGMADREFDVPNTMETKFNLGSINKEFTRVAIGQLMQQGKISPDASIGTYLPDYPNKTAAQSVTIKQLLEMSGGIGDFFGEKFDASSKHLYRENADFVPLFADQPLRFEPGSRREYSNGGYILLGSIVEKLSGMKYHEYVRWHIFKPLGMIATDSYQGDEIVKNRSEGYTWADDNGDRTNTLRNNVYGRPARGSAAGGGYSTAGDLLKFVQGLYAGKLLDRRHTHWYFTRALPPTETFEAETSGAPKNAYFAGAGGSLGINAAIEAEMAAGMIVIVLANYDPPAAEDVAFFIRAVLERTTN